MPNRAPRKPTIFDHLRVFVVVLTLSAGLTLIVGAAMTGGYR